MTPFPPVIVLPAREQVKANTGRDFLPTQNEPVQQSLRQHGPGQDGYVIPGLRLARCRVGATGGFRRNRTERPPV